jgi:hypothetical protein
MTPVGRLHLWSRALATLFALFSAAPTSAEWIEPTLELSSVLIEVTWVADSGELAEVRKRYESPVQRSWAGAGSGGAFRNRPNDGIKAFSVLGKRDGTWVCLIFVERPQLVNDARTLQLGHELAHCLLGAYHSSL